MVYDYKLHLTIRTPLACQWEQSVKCKWNFDAGLGVKLVNEDIVKVGIQSEVLI